VEFSRSCLNDHDRTRQVDERTVVLGLSLPANSQAAEIVVPTVGTLDHPTAWFAAHAAHEGRFAPAANVRSHAAFACLVLAILVVVALVEADVLWPARSSRGADRDRIKRGAYHPLVVDVRAGQRDGEGDTTPVRQNVAFCAEFSAIGRAGAREVPPFGAFTEALSSDVHSRSSPTFSW
jgi:hypothetical protein